jgi:hypothetical protein
MQRIKARKNRIDLRRVKHGSGDYPPDHGWARSRRWNRNHLCIPCRFSARKSGKCPHCGVELVGMPWKFSVPRKQDRWWASQQAFEFWLLHLEYLDNPAKKYLEAY